MNSEWLFFILYAHVSPFSLEFWGKTLPFCSLVSVLKLDTLAKLFVFLCYQIFNKKSALLLFQRSALQSLNIILVLESYSFGGVFGCPMAS